MSVVPGITIFADVLTDGVVIIQPVTGGITQLNGLTTAVQTFDTIDVAELGIEITSAGSNHNISIVRLSDYELANIEQISAHTLLGNSTGSSANPSALSTSAVTTMILPVQTGQAGKVLSTDGSGVLSWIAAGLAGTVTSVNGSGANGISVSGGPITASGSLTIGISANGIALDRIAAIADQRFLGNVSGSSTNAIALTPTQVKTGLSLENVENTALSTWGGSTNLITVGTVTAGTWSATAIAANKGGTGQTSYALGDTLYASGASVISKLSGNITTTKKYLNQTGNGAASAAPSWDVIVADDYPIFLASGIGHARGAVPDPGGVAGSTKFLREDATWAIPPGAGTVLSVDGTGANGINVTGGPITSSGTLTIGISDNGISFGKIATVAANSILGNNTGSPATAIALTATQTKTLLSLNLVENTALSTWGGTTNIITLGTIVTGVWNGTVITEPFGGTGLSTYALGDILYSDATNSLAKLTGNTTTTKKFLTQTGDGVASAAPGWNVLVAGDVPSLAASIITSGTLAVARGGTNTGSYAKGDVLIASAATTLTKLGVGTNGQVLTADSGETTGVKWATPSAGAGTVTSVDGTGANGIDVTGGPITTTGTLTIGITDNGINLVKIQQIADQRLLGNNAGMTDDVIELSPTQVKVMLDLDNVENTALSTWTGSLNIELLGTITDGVWNSSTPIAPTYGGTGLTAYTLGDLLYASNATTLVPLAGNITADQKVLAQTGNGATSAAPSWVLPPQVIGGGAEISSLSGGGTGYSNPFGVKGGLSATNNLYYSFIAPKTMLLHSLYIRVELAPGAGDTIVVTVLKNGVATALTATIAGAVAVSASDLVNTVSVAAGDRLMMQVDGTGTPASTELTWGFIG